MEHPKRYQRGYEFHVKVIFDAPLDDGEFPMVYAIGPDGRHLRTRATIKPDSWGNWAFQLSGLIPDEAPIGSYEIYEVEVLYSKTGMDDAVKRRNYPRGQLDGELVVMPLAFEVQ